jgi:protein FrlC
MRISTATSILVNFPLKSAIDKVISLGFDGVDIWTGRPHLYRKDYSAEAVTELGVEMKERGLSAVTVMPAFYRYPYSLSSPIEPICKDTICYMKDSIDNAVLIGADNVLVVPLSTLFDQKPEDARRVFVRNLAKVCDYAEQKQIKLGIEVLNKQVSNFVYKASHAVEIIRELQSDYLGIVLDSGQVMLSEDSFEAAMDLVSDKLINVHINDCDGINQTNSIPGDCCIDFYKIGEILRKYSYDGFLSLELGYQFSDNPLPVLKKALKATRGFFCL